MLVLDYETRSSVDLKKHGGRRYAAGDDTSVLCGVAFDGRKLWLWSPFPEHCSCCDLGVGSFEVEILLGSDDPPPSLLERLNAGEPVIGHNAWAFDQHIARGLGCSWNWVDSLPRVRRRGMPGGLDKLGDLLYGMGKDKDGQRVLRMSMSPGKKGFVDPDRHRLTHLFRYCARDVVVLAQAWFDLGLGEPHVDDPVLDVHRVINERGIKVDVATARRIQRAEVRLSEEAVSSSPVGLRTLRSPKAMCAWLKQKGVKRNGFPVTDVTEPTVKKLLAVDWPDEEITRALKARLQVCTVTGGKIRALLDRVCPDGRLRDTTAYYAAHTGRWGGRGFQVQNLPRGEKALLTDAWDPEVPLIRDGGDLTEASEKLQSMLRGVLVGESGGEREDLVVCDLDQIEYRVLRWLAGDSDALDRVRQGRDPYADLGERIGLERNAAKVVELACGYQGGVGALNTWVEKFGMRFPIDEQEAIEAWRDANHLIAGTRRGKQTWQNPKDPSHVVAVRSGGLWRDLLNAASSVANNGGTKTVGRLEWYSRGALVVADSEGRMLPGSRVGEAPLGWLYRTDLVCRLPSGREFVYPQFRPEKVLTEDGVKQTVPRYSMNGNVRVGTYGGKICENLTQAVARDVMAWHLVELERRGLKPVLHAHDEIVCDTTDIDGVNEVMNTAPPWADGLPVSADAKLVRRYEK